MADAVAVPDAVAPRSLVTSAEAEVLVVGVVAAAAAFVAGLAGCAPTGIHATDVALTALLAAVVVALGSRATPLALAAGGFLAVAAGGTLPLRAVGAAALVLVVARLRAGRSDRPGEPSITTVLSGALAALLIVQVLVRIPFTDPARGSAVVALAGMVPVAWSGWRRLAPSSRRAGRRVALGLAVVAAVGLATGTVAGLLAASALRDGVRSTDAGVDAVRQGDQAAAEADFRAATADLRSARAMTRAWWAAPARHVPLVAPQIAVLDTIADGGADTAALAADGAGRIDADRLRLVDGRLDPDVVAEVGPVLTEVADGTAALGRQLEAADVGSVWRIPPVADGLARFTGDVADAEGSARTGALAAEVGPELLGQDGVARYFVAFVTPSEARGTGFLGNYGLLTVTDGVIDLAEVGRNKDLNAAGPAVKEISGPRDYVQRYTRFEPQSTWENVTFTPDGPTAAQVMAELYPQSGGVEVDGVIRIDPTGLSRLLRLTGPVAVSGLPYELDATNVVPFLEVEQYRLFQVREERIDLLGDVAEGVFDALTSGDGPAPARLAKALGPAVEGGHASFWMRSPRAQELVERLGATGAVPPVRGDGFGVVAQNAGGNKIDAFLQRTVRYTADVDARTGRVVATAEIGLKNLAPDTGEPPYIIDNLVDAPAGTNRMWLSLYSPLDLTVATIDGEPVTLQGGRELGRNVWSVFVDVPAGGTANLTLELEGAIDLSAGRYRFDLLPQTMVRPDRVDVTVRVTGGELDPVAGASSAPGGVEEVEGEVRASVAASEGTWSVVAAVTRADEGAP